jgi:hypothetical protein
LSRSAVVLATLALLLFATPAHASPRRVAVLEADLELLRALHLALSPWDVTTVRSSAPADSLARDPDLARCVARVPRAAASAVGSPSMCNCTMASPSR